MGTGGVTRLCRMPSTRLSLRGRTHSEYSRLASRSTGGLMALTLVLATACNAGSGTHQSTQSIIYLPCCGIPGPKQDPQANRVQDYRPRTVSFDATGSHVLQNATWQVWSATEAIAVGTAEINSCEPACAGGRYYEDPVIVTLSEPQKCDGSWFWSKAVWHFPDGIPPGEKRNQTWSILLGC